MTLLLASGGGGNANVAAVVATATWAAVAPAVSADASVNVMAVVATATWAAVAPTVAASAGVTAVVGTESWAGVAPVASGDAGIAAVKAAETWAGVAPVVSGAAGISAVAAAETWSAVAPVVTAVSGDALISAVVAAVSWSASAPAVTLGEVQQSSSDSGGPPRPLIVTILPQHAAVRARRAKLYFDALAPLVLAEQHVAIAAPLPVGVSFQAVPPSVSGESNVVSIAAYLRMRAPRPRVSADAGITAQTAEHVLRFKVAATQPHRIAAQEITKAQRVAAKRKLTRRRVPFSMPDLAAKNVPLLREIIATFLRSIGPKAAADAKKYLASIQKAKSRHPVEIDWTPLVGLLIPFLSDTHRSASRRAHADVTGLGKANVTSGFDQLNDLASQYARDRAAELVGMKWVNGELVVNPDAEWAISETTREELQAMIQRAIDEGMSPADLAAEIEGSFDFSSGRAEMIARTELADAQSQGALEGWRASGVVDGKEWLTGDDPCDDCAGNADDGVIPLDDVFSSGDDAPPLHPHCECSIVAVIEEVSDEEAA